MYIIPHIDDELKAFAKSIGCVWIGAVLVTPKPLCKELNCHNNVCHYVSNYGGAQKLGYYFIKSVTTNKYEAVLHSVVDKSGDLLDITPFNDTRMYNIFGLLHTNQIDNLSYHIVSK